MNIIENLRNYHLIGIGEFSHGINESWIFRFNLLKYFIKNSNKKITIFNEQSEWQANNIMNFEYYNKNLDKFMKYDGVKIEKSYKTSEGYIGGKLWQYVHHSSESKIFLNIIRYIRKHINRIKIIGVDNDNIDRDFDMANIILNNLNKKHINFFWAHNAHVDNRKLSLDNLKWINNKNHKWFCGYYLKEKLKNKYCIILSQSYEGINRFNGYCVGNYCKNRTWQLTYIYKKFKYQSNKKYVDANKSYQLLEKFDSKLIEFSNSYYQKNKYGHQMLIHTNSFNYILFFNKTSELKPFCVY